MQRLRADLKQVTLATTRQTEALSDFSFGEGQQRATQVNTG